MNILPVIQLGRRERKKKAVRENICEQTLHLISRYGVEGITIDAICDCVDIAKKTFYNYYSSKHDLLVDICQAELLQRTNDLITEAIAQSDDLGAQLEFVLGVLATRNSTASKLERELIGYLVSSLSTNMNQGAGQLQFMNDCFFRLYDHSKAQLKAGSQPATPVPAARTNRRGGIVTVRFTRPALLDAQCRAGYWSTRRTMSSVVVKRLARLRESSDDRL